MSIVETEAKKKKNQTSKLFHESNEDWFPVDLCHCCFSSSSFSPFDIVISQETEMLW